VSREPATLLILAGGASRRMGFPKHELHVEGVDILTHLYRRLGHLFVETIVVGREIGEPPPGARLVEDLYNLRAPLVGIHGGLTAAATDLCFVGACDMPHVEPTLVECLLEAAADCDVVVPVVRGHVEPLCAVYRRSCLKAIEELIERATLKVSRLYDLVCVRKVGELQVRLHDPELRSVANLNVPSQIEQSARP
jgi:molybdopterin-guanine dinucleotide biosynthesis protein A